MVLTSEIEGNPVRGAGGAVIGTVSNVLFHPTESRAIGLMLRPPAALVVVSRPVTFLPLSAVRFDSKGAVTDLAKLHRGRAGAQALGHDPDTTIIWTGMDVRGPSDRIMGVVSDVEFDPESGAVGRIEVAAGVVADTAHGRLVVPAELLEGYREGAVHVSVESASLEASGGLAKAAARTAVVASAAMNAVGEAVGDSVVAASGAAGRAIKKVNDSKVAEKAAARVKGTWRDTVQAFRDGMNDDD